MAPLIAAALKLLPLVPSAFSLFTKAKSEPDKLQVAAEVINLAKQAMHNTDVIPKSDAELSLQLQQHPAARDTFKNLVAEREQEWRTLILKDVQHAREVSGKQHASLIEAMATKVMRENIWFVVVMVVIQVACMIYFGDNGVLLALIGNVIGVVVGQLLSERMQVLSYLFGATFVKDKKDDNKGS